MINGLLLEPGKTAKKITIENNLESLQNIVGGYIEVIHCSNHPETAIIVNEEGRLRNLQPNRYISGHYIVGNIILLKEDGENFTSLSEKELAKYKRLYGSKSFI